MSTLTDGLDTLGKYLGRPISAEARIAYAKALSGIDDRAIADALAHWMRSHSPSSTLPSPADLRGFAPAPKPASDPRDTTQPWQHLERTARTDYQTAVARLMRVTLRSDEPTKARLYRAFAAEWRETTPWVRLAEYAEAEPWERARMLRDDRAEETRVWRMNRARLAAMRGAV